MRQLGEVSELPDCREEFLLDAVSDCDALLVKTRCQVTRRVIDAAPRLRVIGRGGIGLDNIDLKAAAARGIPVVYTPHASTESVADLTFALILGLTWNLTTCDLGVREGKFTALRNSFLTRELSALRLGIIGMGRIGCAVARRAVHGFFMEVLYHDIVDPGDSLGISATRVEKEQLLSDCDIVSLHVPLTEQTQGLIGDDSFKRMRAGALLINTSRGAIVDSAALVRSLRSGRLAGAGLDVFDPEPLPADHELLTIPNTLFSPHVGARTALAQARMNAVVDDVARVLKGERPIYPA